MDNFTGSVAEYVNSPGFFKDLVRDIEATDNPMARAKLKFDLLNFSVPKVKTTEAVSSKTGQMINIEFHEASNPKVSEESADKVSED